MSYSSVSILALIIIFIINYDIFDRNENSIPAHRAYRAFLISVSAYYVTDLLWGFLYEAGKIGLVYADTALYFVAMAYTILLWTRFVIAYLKGNRMFSRVMNITGRVIFAFQLLVILVNFFRPILFHFDEHGVYHAGVARYIILVAQTAMFLMTAAYAFAITLKSTGTRRLRHRTIGLFSIIMAVFDILQVCYSLLPMYAVGCLLGTCLLHSFVLESEKEEYRGDLEEKLRESLEKGNCFDSLTGLPSMTYFFELADAEKDAVLKRGGEPALLYMDFSGMKFYNRNHGFSEGDKLLKEFANLLVRFFGNDRCCRIGGDHFAAITEADGLEDRLHQLFRECRDMNGGKSLPVHVGIYAGTDGHIHASFACDRAKLACGELSGAYASCYHYYKKELSDDAERRQYIVENIDRAIAEGWIQVYYQPIIRAVNEKVCDEEALARWIDPVRGFLSPVSFIPALEDAGLIYKLDLHILEQVLGHIKTLEAEKLYVVPHSINLSRADFDACDIVEEIRRRVDEAGVSRDRITIEITESIIGADFDFIKEQVLRFRNLGFPVWMDDFGSGYSSLDVLQSIRFDLLKFDMSFMKKLDEGESAKVILTELMKMAASLGLETVCEGVETEEQVSFLQEIGCSKLQGYYYARPNPFSSGLAWFKEHRDALENPEETAYYESIGRVNLFDLGVVASEDDNSIQNTFDSIPIAILEVRDDTVGYVRSSRSYRDFIERFFHVDMPKELTGFGNTPFGYGTTFVSIVKQCCSSGSLAFFDERMPDGSRVHSLARRINVNPVTGSVAIAIAVLSVTKPDESTTFADIARALAADYYNIYVIDLDTDAYIEYSSRIGGEELLIERHGKDFFETAKRDMVTRIYEEDKELFVKWVTKENVLRELDAQGVFTASYRLIDTGTPMYVNMKIMKMQGGNRIILGISVIDAQMKQQEEEKKLRQAKTSLGRIAALSPNYIVLYTIDPETGHYMQYNPSNEFEKFGLEKQGEDFFADVRLDAPKAIDPRDMERHLRTLTKDNMMREIQTNGMLTYNYRLLLDGKPVPVSLKAALVEEDDGEKIILGVNKVFAEEPNTNESEVVYTHIAHALARGCTDLYYVNMETDEFIEYHTDDNLGVLTEVRRGTDFFESCERDVKLFVYPEDQEKFVKVMNRAFLTDALERSSVYEFSYRRIKDGRVFYVEMKASRMEDDKRLAVIAVSDIDELVRKRRAEERM